jgi:hypothetical protein
MTRKPPERSKERERGGGHKKEREGERGRVERQARAGQDPPRIFVLLKKNIKKNKKYKNKNKHSTRETRYRP